MREALDATADYPMRVRALTGVPQRQREQLRRIALQERALLTRHLG